MVGVDFIYTFTKLLLVTNKLLFANNENLFMKLYIVYFFFLPYFIDKALEWK
jgi:hypothetical protein